MGTCSTARSDGILQSANAVASIALMARLFATLLSGQISRPDAGGVRPIPITDAGLCADPQSTPVYVPLALNASAATCAPTH